MDAANGVAIVNGLRMHYRYAGSGPLVVLLHGWPQTSYCWRHLIGPLSSAYTVVAPDLRGYGRTDKPVGGYDKRTMAGDVRELVHSLGHRRVRLVGHDRGARVAHRYALDHPEEVEKLAVLDIIPTRAMWENLDARVARQYWHWLFHLQPDLPELLVGANVGGYVRYFLEKWTVNRHAFDDAAVDHYVRAFSQPGALRAGFDDYRASFPADQSDDEVDAGRKLELPVLALWGASGLLGSLPTLDIWREYAADLRGVGLEECGHFLPEERPAEVLTHLEKFLAE